MTMYGMHLHIQSSTVIVTLLINPGNILMKDHARFYAVNRSLLSRKRTKIYYIRESVDSLCRDDTDAPMA